MRIVKVRGSVAAWAAKELENHSLWPEDLATIVVENILVLDDSDIYNELMDIAELVEGHEVFIDFLVLEFVKRGRFDEAASILKNACCESTASLLDILVEKVYGLDAHELKKMR